MTTLDVIILVLYFLGLIAVSFVVSRKIKSSEDMFIAGRNSSWWLSGISSYMTIFSASTFVVWGGVAYKSGLTAVAVAMCLGVASFVVGKWIAGRWRELTIKSPGEFLTIRFGRVTLNFYTVIGIIARGVHTAVSIYSVAIIMCALIPIPPNTPFSFLASSGAFGDSVEGYLSIWWALLILGSIALIYTVAGGFLAVLMTDVVQFGVLIAVVIFMIPLSFNAVGGVEEFISRGSMIPGFFEGTSKDYNWLWLVMWFVLNVGMIGGDWPFVQRYISVPTKKDAKKSTYLIGVLYIVTPLIWYLPTMIMRTLEPGLGLDFDAATLNFNGEHAYVNMSALVLMNGMLGMMLAAMLSATLSCVSGTLNVYANVFTYEIWNRFKNNKKASEKKRIRAGRMFTLIFGLAIIGVSLLVPFAGGAEKVVVTLLTMVMCPLYIPAIWGLFSKRLKGTQLIQSMCITWIVGFGGKFLIPTDIISASLWESIAGCIIPIIFLTFTTVVASIRGKSCSLAENVKNYIDKDVDKEPSEKMKKATKAYSLMAINFFLITIGFIAAMLTVLLLIGDPDTVAVKDITIGFIIGIVVLILIYVIYRIVDKIKSKK